MHKLWETRYKYHKARYSLLHAIKELEAAGVDGYLLEPLKGAYDAINVCIHEIDKAESTVAKYCK